MILDLDQATPAEPKDASIPIPKYKLKRPKIFSLDHVKPEEASQKSDEPSIFEKPKLQRVDSSSAIRNHISKKDGFGGTDKLNTPMLKDTRTDSQKKKELEELINDLKAEEDKQKKQEDAEKEKKKANEPPPQRFSLFKSKVKKAYLDINSFQKLALRKQWIERPEQYPKIAEQVTNDIGKLDSKLYKGQYFGEKALEDSNIKRSASIMANCNSEVLVLSRDTFCYVKKRFNKETREMINFLQDSFPNLDHISSNNIIDGFLYIIEEETYSMNNTIIKEGETGDKFYLIYEGSCEMYKNVIFDQSDEIRDGLQDVKKYYKFKKSNKDVKFSLLTEKTFFGEEVLLGFQRKYDFTVKASSNHTRVFSFKKTKLLVKFPIDVLVSLQNIYKQKKENFDKAIERKFEGVDEDKIKCIDGNPRTIIIKGKENLKYDIAIVSPSKKGRKQKIPRHAYSLITKLENLSHDDDDDFNREDDLNKKMAKMNFHSRVNTAVSIEELIETSQAPSTAGTAQKKKRQFSMHTLLSTPDNAARTFNFQNTSSQILQQDTVFTAGSLEGQPSYFKSQQASPEPQQHLQHQILNQSPSILSPTLEKLITQDDQENYTYFELQKNGHVRYRTSPIKELVQEPEPSPPIRAVPYQCSRVNESKSRFLQQSQGRTIVFPENTITKKQLRIYRKRKNMDTSDQKEGHEAQRPNTVSSMKSFQKIKDKVIKNKIKDLKRGFARLTYDPDNSQLETIDFINTIEMNQPLQQDSLSPQGVTNGFNKAQEQRLSVSQQQLLRKFKTHLKHRRLKSEQLLRSGNLILPKDLVDQEQQMATTVQNNEVVEQIKQRPNTTMNDQRPRTSSFKSLQIRNRLKSSSKSSISLNEITPSKVKMELQFLSGIDTKSFRKSPSSSYQLFKK